MSNTTYTKIAEIEAEMARTQKNKATEGHQGLLKAKIAKLKREIIDMATKSSGGTGEGFDVSKSGDTRVGLIGFPSVGKSTLLTKLTDTESEVASQEFTTLTCIPGTIHYMGARIQLLDLPGIIEGAKDGKGRGKQVIGVARTCNLILIVLDSVKPCTHKFVIERELEGFGIRLNKTQPDIRINKKEKGGIGIVKLKDCPNLDDDTIRSICIEYKRHNCDIQFNCNATADDLIDVIEGNRIYIPCVQVLNKIDAITQEELKLYKRMPNCVPISSSNEWNLDGLLEYMWYKLDLIRVQTKPRGEIPDYDKPVILKRKNCTVESFCNKIHRKMLEQFKYGIVWGSSVKYNPQNVGKDHKLADEDIIQIVKKI